MTSLEKPDLKCGSRPKRLMDVSGLVGDESVDSRALVLRERAGGVAELPGRVVQHHFTSCHSQSGRAFQANGFTDTVFLALVTTRARNVLSDGACAETQHLCKNQTGKNKSCNGQQPTAGDLCRCRKVMSACRRRGSWSAERYPMMVKVYHEICRLQAWFSRFSSMGRQTQPGCLRVFPQNSGSSGEFDPHWYMVGRLFPPAHMFVDTAAGKTIRRLW